MKSHSQQLALAAMFCLVFGASSSLAAGENWFVRLELEQVQPQGHDPRVVDVRGATNTNAILLETQSGFGYGFGIRHDRGGNWAWGIDGSWFTGVQEGLDPGLSSDGSGTIEYQFAGGTLVSQEPDSVLYFRRLPDTDMNAWTIDLFALRKLKVRDNATVRLLFGLRNADFDNDNRFAIGLENVGGQRIDASSNYPRMIGPLIGVVVDRQWGSNAVELTATASVVSGDAELFSKHTDFFGPFEDNQDRLIGVEDFSQTESATIPIADLRLRWDHWLARHFAFGLGLSASHWSNVPIPPGVSPGDTPATLHETSFTLARILAGISFRF